MIKDFLEKNYCPKNCDELSQKECREGVRTRCLDFEEREKLLEDFDFAEWEHNRLAQRIVELQKEKGVLIDENRQAKELLRQWFQLALKNRSRCYGFIKDTEQFLKESE